MSQFGSTLPSTAKSALSAAMSAIFSTTNNPLQVPAREPLAPVPSTAGKATVTKEPTSKEVIQSVPKACLIPSTQAITPSVNKWAIIIKGSLAKGVDAIFDTGDYLIAAKKALGHGKFLDMLKEQVHFCPRQAQKYMRIAGNPVLRNANYSSLIPRQVSVIYPLSGIEDLLLVQALEQMKNKVKHGERIKINKLTSWELFLPQLANNIKMAKTASQGGKAQGNRAQQQSQVAVTHEIAGNFTTDEIMAPAAPKRMEPAITPINSTVNESPQDQVSDIPQVTEKTIGEEVTVEAAAKPTEESTEETTEETNDELNAGESNLNSEEGNAQHTALSPDSSTNGKIIPMAGHIPASPASAGFNPTEQQQTNQLVELWECRMEQEWHNYPINVRINFLKKKLWEVEAEANEERKAA